MTWNTEVRLWIETNQYEQVARFYEELTEVDPLEIRHYWYLGLAYLLGGREEEAQTTWFFVLGQGEDAEVESWIQELGIILAEEANRQAELGNLDRSWLIRGHLGELVPNYLDNLLAIILLEIPLNRFHPDKLKEKNIIELLASGMGEKRLIERTLEAVIAYPHKNSIEFARSSLPCLTDSPELIENCLNIARQIAYQRRQPRYSSDLLEIFRQCYPNNWYIAVTLFWFYIATPNFTKAYALARELKEQSPSIDLQLFSASLLLNGLMRGSNWEEIPALCQEYKRLIKQFLQTPPRDVHPLVRDSLLTVMNPLSYYEDNPRENRPLLAQIGAYFQNNYREAIEFPTIIEGSQRLDRKTAHIKLGYIAQTLRRHPVGLLSRWVMQYHDRNQFHLTLYLIDQPVDDITQKWFSNPEDTIRQFPVNSLAIAQQIQEDDIDILIDLDSGTTPGVAQVMALKPAPVQVNWLGFDGSGLPSIDYLLADPYVLPESAQTYYPEKIWRLPHTFVAVDGFELAVPTLKRADLGIEADAVVYLSSQTAIKRNPDILQLQLKILHAVPDSYFVIQGVADEESLHRLLISIARQEGVQEERIKMIPLYPTELYRANLGIADVILDTYPFNGGTTTLEALWMGIPIVTKVGQQWSSRNGYTLMMNAGITEGIAWSDEEYVEWGIRFGLEETLREEIRWKLRQSRHTSPLWNARQFTRSLEMAYQQMWQIHSASFHQ